MLCADTFLLESVLSFCQGATILLLYKYTQNDVYLYKSNIVTFAVSTNVEDA